jgi:hypothetical protein
VSRLRAALRKRPPSVPFRELPVLRDWCRDHHILDEWLIDNVALAISATGLAFDVSRARYIAPVVHLPKGLQPLTPDPFGETRAEFQARAGKFYDVVKRHYQGRGARAHDERREPVHILWLAKRLLERKTYADIHRDTAPAAKHTDVVRKAIQRTASWLGVTLPTS